MCNQQLKMRGNNMICAYCKKEAKPTKEHIISSGILDLFPECFLTIDSNRGKIYPAFWKAVWLAMLSGYITASAIEPGLAASHIAFSSSRKATLRATLPA